MLRSSLRHKEWPLCLGCWRREDWHFVLYRHLQARSAESGIPKHVEIVSSEKVCTRYFSAGHNFSDTWMHLDRTNHKVWLARNLSEDSYGTRTATLKQSIG